MSYSMVDAARDEYAAWDKVLEARGHLDSCINLGDIYALGTLMQEVAMTISAYGEALTAIGARLREP